MSEGTGFGDLGARRSGLPRAWRHRPVLRRGRPAGLFARHLLADAGIAHGDRAAVMLHEPPEFVVAVHAVHHLGAAVVLVSPAWKATEVEHAVRLTKPVHGVADGPSVPVLRQMLPVTDVDDVAVPHQPVDRMQVLQDDEAVLVFSSGTTGMPKVIRHHQSRVATGNGSGVRPTDADRFQSDDAAVAHPRALASSSSRRRGDRASPPTVRPRRGPAPDRVRADDPRDGGGTASRSPWRTTRTSRRWTCRRCASSCGVRRR